MASRPVGQSVMTRVRCAGSFSASWTKEDRGCRYEKSRTREKNLARWSRAMAQSTRLLISIAPASGEHCMNPLAWASGQHPAKRLGPNLEGSRQRRARFVFRLAARDGHHASRRGGGARHRFGKQISCQSLPGDEGQAVHQTLADSPITARRGVRGFWLRQRACVARRSACTDSRR